MRRLLAAAVALGVLVLGTAQPAHAAAPEVRFDTPVDGQTFPVPAFAFDATVHMANGGTVRGNVTVSWFSPENRPVPATTTHASGNQNTVDVGIPDRVFPYNGTYRVDVRATGRDPTLDTNGDESVLRSAQFLIDAPPAPPGGVATAVDDQRRTTVSWAANGEPDMVGYEVQRQLGSSSWEQVTVTDATTTAIVDEATASQGGTYRYRVVAYRASADVSKLNPSAPSSTTTAVVAAPPTTTTTTTTQPPDDDEEDEVDEDEDQDDEEQSRTGSRTGTGTGGTTRRTGGSSATTLPSKGKVDLSGFASLLDEARRTGQTPPSGRRADVEEDGGYDEKLPFGSRTKKASGDGDDVAILDEGIGDDGSGRVQSMAFLAGGLLATVLVMHLLWVRSEVRRAGLLEAIPPEPSPSRPRRRRPLPDLPPEAAK